ncbi:MAG: Heme chaperone HemW [Chlamydiales bacterium]|nr:Heme chaperone HemW [Chlamydiales bacterium]MCH9620521.1 Heme chaperone HemW [Chlamydiales bacterium]MCH9623024.1 Heme chaperone HemW [Chlamydiales bacterium]
MSYSIYIHVPFCTRKCDYCNFYVIPDKDLHKELYFKYLRKEFELRRHLLPKEGLLSLYFGGGTPSLLGPNKIKEIIKWFEPDQTVEVTLEANPEHLTPQLAKDYYSSGVNRISLGAQSFNTAHLVQLTRRHTPSQAQRAVEAAFEAGIENISIDLMYDLPNQTAEGWQESLLKATSLPIKHISLYNLTIEPHTAFHKNPPPQPQDSLSLHLLQMAVSHFESEQFNRYEISAFSKPGFESRHNMGYWKARPFLGFGPSAFSDWNKSRFRNIANLNRYARKLERGEDPVDFSEKLEPEKRKREQLAIALRLMCGVEYEPLLAPLIKEGLLIQKKERVCLTERGKLFYDTVAERIIF